MSGTAGYPVCFWPSALPAHAGLVVIGVDGDALQTAPAGERALARSRIRMALRSALGELTAVPPDEIMIQSRPGHAPAVSFPGQGRRALPGIAISHDEPVSLAAIHLHGPVGVDLMRVQAFDDWEAVARDYLGPHAAALLASGPPAERARAFAQAWTEHEARLKCHGLPLDEWSPQLAATLARCRCHALALPEDRVGAVAWLD